MKHLTAEEIERLAEAGASATTGERARHLASCDRCREEVALLRTLTAELAGLELLGPSDGFADTVMSRVQMPQSALDRQLARLPRFSPAPGFVTSVLARVRLPVPWPQRLRRFVRQRRAAVAAVALATLTASGVSAAWLFGSQGMTPGRLIAFVAGGAGAVAVDVALALGRLAYRVGLLDAGGSIIEGLDPVATLGSLGLLALLGLGSLWAMTRLSRGGPQPVAIGKAV